MSKHEIQKLTEGYIKNEHGLIVRTVCYVRVSTNEQKLHGLSLDAQRDTLSRYAESHGLKIVGWYEDEGVSGRKLIRKRPALQRMLNDAKEGKFDRIIFIKLDRYFRSVAEYHESQKILEKHNVLWTATEEVYDLTTANGRYWVQQKLAMAEYEADNTGERIKLVNEYKIRDGQALVGAQLQGLAYTVQKDANGIKRVVPDPATKELVTDYINYFLTYQNKKQAMLYVNNKYNVNHSYNSYGKLLIDTKLYGHYKGNDNYCTPYIDKDTFNKIQDILGYKNVKTTPSKKVYMFTGLIVCPCCGNNLSATSNTNKNKKGKPTLSYRCNKKAKEEKCVFKKHINENKLEAYLLSNLDKYVNEYIDEAKVADARIQDSHAEEKVKAIKEELRKTNRMYKAGNMSDKEYDAETAEIKERLALAEAELEPIVERDLTRYEELLKSGWRDLYEALTKENRRAFWRKYINHIIVTENGTVDRVKFF